MARPARYVAVADITKATTVAEDMEGAGIAAVNSFFSRGIGRGVRAVEEYAGLVRKAGMIDTIELELGAHEVRRRIVGWQLQR